MPIIGHRPVASHHPLPAMGDSPVDIPEGPLAPLPVPFKDEICAAIDTLEGGLESLHATLSDEWADNGVKLDNLKDCQNQLTSLKEALGGKSTPEVLTQIADVIGVLAEEIPNYQQKIEPSRLLKLCDKMGVLLGVTLWVAVYFAVAAAVASGVLPAATALIGLAGTIWGCYKSMAAEFEVAHLAAIKGQLASVVPAIESAQNLVTCAANSVKTRAAIRDGLSEQAQEILNDLLQRNGVVDSPPSEATITLALKRPSIDSTTKRTLMLGFFYNKLSFSSASAQTDRQSLCDALESDAKRKSEAKLGPVNDVAPEWLKLQKCLRWTSQGDAAHPEQALPLQSSPF